MIDAEVIVSLPGINRGGSAEAVRLIFEPDIGQSDGSKALVLSFLGKGFVSKELLLVLLNEGGVKNTCFESLVQEHALHKLDVCRQANDLVVIKS